jgi:hypothetical protein
VRMWEIVSGSVSRLSDGVLGLELAPALHPRRVMTACTQPAHLKAVPKTQPVASGISLCLASALGVHGLEV